MPARPFEDFVKAQIADVAWANLCLRHENESLHARIKELEIELEKAKAERGDA